LGSSERDDERSVSLESLGETNGEMNYASLNRSWLGLCFATGLLGKKIGVAIVAFPNFSLSLPWDGFS
jgi:hypothetical protein